MITDRSSSSEEKPQARAPHPTSSLGWGVAIAVATFVLFTVPVLLGARQADGHADRPWATALLGVAVAAPLVWARRAPRGALGIIAVSLSVAALTGTPVTPFVSDLGPALGLAALACALWLPRRDGLVAVATAAAAVSLADIVALHLHPARDQDLVQLVVVAGGWLVGDLLRTRRAAVDQVAAERARRLAEHDARVRVEERLRLSRDVHDVVSHSLSVIAVRAGVGRMLLESNPAEARDALAAIESVSRRSLDDLRGVLAGMGDVRVQDGGSAGSHPVLADVPDLVASTHGAGLTTELVISGEHTYEPLLETSAYRLVQESLTNAAKHAPAARVRVLLDRASTLRVVVEDDGGAGIVGERPVATAGLAASGSGVGIDGMRARVALHDGSLVAGPTPAGGWTIIALFGPADQSGRAHAAGRTVRAGAEPDTGPRAEDPRRHDAV